MMSRASFPTSFRLTTSNKLWSLSVFRLNKIDGFKLASILKNFFFYYFLFTLKAIVTHWHFYICKLNTVLEIFFFKTTKNLFSVRETYFLRKHSFRRKRKVIFLKRRRPYTARSLYFSILHDYPYQFFYFRRRSRFGAQRIQFQLQARLRRNFKRFKKKKFIKKRLTRICAALGFKKLVFGLTNRKFMTKNTINRNLLLRKLIKPYFLFFNKQTKTYINSLRSQKIFLLTSIARRKNSFFFLVQRRFPLLHYLYFNLRYLTWKFIFKKLHFSLLPFQFYNKLVLLLNNNKTSCFSRVNFIKSYYTQNLKSKNRLLKSSLKTFFFHKKIKQRGSKFSAIGLSLPKISIFTRYTRKRLWRQKKNYNRYHWNSRFLRRHRKNFSNFYKRSRNNQNRLFSRRYLKFTLIKFIKKKKRKFKIRLSCRKLKKFFITLKFLVSWPLSISYSSLIKNFTYLLNRYFSKKHYTSIHNIFYFFSYLSSRFSFTILSRSILTITNIKKVNARKTLLVQSAFYSKYFLQQHHVLSRLSFFKQIKKWLLLKQLIFKLSAETSTILNFPVQVKLIPIFTFLNSAWKFFSVRLLKWSHINLVVPKKIKFFMDKLIFIFLVGFKFKNFFIFMKYLVSFFKQFRKRQQIIRRVFRILTLEGLFSLNNLVGWRLSINGKLNRRPRAKSISWYRGQYPTLQNTDLQILLSERHLITDFGSYMFRFWLYWY